MKRWPSWGAKSPYGLDQASAITATLANIACGSFLD
jgi:hypothetical protein